MVTAATISIIRKRFCSTSITIIIITSCDLFSDDFPGWAALQAPDRGRRVRKRGWSKSCLENSLNKFARRRIRDRSRNIIVLRATSVAGGGRDGEHNEIPTRTQCSRRRRRHSDEFDAGAIKPIRPPPSANTQFNVIPAKHKRRCYPA